ncbi:MAG TPA: hypothetical protein VLF62_04355 [Candidatus Saccharimonadales bacterium]|nr:hypothetical protein [Candidatus Saccharimonadales bacterium]
MAEQLGLMQEVIANPVFGDTFVADPARFKLILGSVGVVTEIAQPRLTEIVHRGMPEWSDAEVNHVVGNEIMSKLRAAYPGLSYGELSDYADVMAAGTVSVGVMYWGDQTGDRGDRAMSRACEVAGARPVPMLRGAARFRLAGLNRIETNIRSGGDKRGVGPPEDQNFIVPCFYDQVLHNEAYLQRLSRQYTHANAAGKQKFLEHNGAHIADVTTVSAGFPSVSSSLYGIYRLKDPKLAPLSEIYSNIPMQQLIQTCNVVARVWDELGDWYMDSGARPDKGIFVINPFNEYHPSTVERYCELAFIQDPGQVALLKHAFANFHNSSGERQMHSAYILETLRVHVRNYVNTLDKRLPPHLVKRYEQYVTLCKRVLEFAYVNRKGDIDLATPIKE